MTVTVEDLYKDKKFKRDLRTYAQARYDERIFDDKELVEKFLSEYRGIKMNTGNMIGAKNFIEDTDSEEAVKAFGRAYLKVDRDLEDFGTLRGIKDAVDYAGYAITDPLNLFGIGAGKVAGSFAVKALQGNLMNSVAKRLGLGFGAGFAVDAPLEAGANLVLQQTEKQLGEESGVKIRDDIDLAEAGVAGLIGGTVGGALGLPAFAKTVVGGVEGLKTIRQSDEAKEALDAQAPVAKIDTLDQLADKDEAIGTFVRNKNTAIEDALKDPRNVGRVQSIDEGVATVKFSFKDAAGQRQTTEEKIALEELTGLSAKSKDEYLTVFNSTVGKDSLPKEFVERGKQLMIQQGVGSETVDDLISARLNKDITTKVENAVTSLLADDPLLRRTFDPTLRISENIANIISKMTPEDAAEKFGEAFVRLKLTPEDFAAVYIADASFDGMGLAISPSLLKQVKKGAVPDVSKINDEGKIALEIASKINNDARMSQIFKAQRHEREVEEAYQSGFGKFVRNWLGSIVSGPATQVRDTLGLAFQLPGMTLGRFASDGILRPIKYRALGYDVEPESFLKRGAASFQDMGMLFNSQEYLTIVKHHSLGGNTATDAFFKAHSGLPSELKVQEGKVGALQKIIDVHGKYVDFTNIYRRAIDERVTSSLYFSHLNDSIVDAVRRGEITDPNIRTAMDVFRSANPDQYITKTMQDEAVSFALEKTFRRNIQELANEREALPLTMELIGALEKGLSTRAGKAGRFILPFPRFLAALHHYGSTRTYMLPVNVIRRAREGFALKKEIPASERAAKRAELTDLIETISAKQAEYRNIPVNQRKEAPALKLLQDMKELSSRKDDLDLQFGQIEEYYRKLDRTIRQASDTAILAGLAYAMSEGAFSSIKLEPTDRYNIYKFGETEVDFSPLFPFNLFLYLNKAIKAFAGDAKPGEPDLMISDLAEDFQEVILGSNVRGGSAAYIVREIKKVYRGDEDTTLIEDIAKIAGATLGNVVNGLTTMSRPIDGILKTLGPADARTVREKRLDKFVDEFEIEDITFGMLDQTSLVSAKAATNLLNEFISEAIKNNPFETIELDFSGFRKFEGERMARIDPQTGKPLKSARAPLLKEATGALPLSQDRFLERELQKLDYDFYRDFKRGNYSRIPQYEVIQDTLVGLLSAREIIPRMKNPGYKQKTIDQKRTEVKDYYKGLFQRVRKIIKGRYPVLVRYDRLFENFSRDNVNRALRELKAENPDLVTSLTYYGELDPSSQLYIKDERKRQAARDALNLLEAVEKRVKSYEKTETRTPTVSRPKSRFSQGGMVEDQMSSLSILN